MHTPWGSLQEEVRRVEAAAAVAASPESIRHLAGVHFASQAMIRRRLAFAIIPAQGEPTLLVQAVLEGTARSQGIIPQVATYVTEPIEGLARVLAGMDLPRGELLAELDFLPAADARALGDRLPGWFIRDAGDLFRTARQVRTPGEQEALRRCARAAERAIQVAVSMAAGGGVTEREVYARMQDAMLRLGGGVIPFLTLSSGPERTLLTHASPTDRLLQPGDLLLVDAVGFFAGLYTDMARTVVVGEATGEQRDLYRRVRAMQQDVISAVRPGATAGEVYEKYLGSVKAHGVTYTYRYAGHSTGYQVVEEPVLMAGSEARLLPGMVLCVEVKDRVPGVGAVQLEEIFLLTEEGPRIWTDLMASDELPEIR